MTQPLQAPYRAGMLAHEFRQSLDSVHDLFTLTGSVAGLEVVDSAEHRLQLTEHRLRQTADPLAASLRWMPSGSPSRAQWHPQLPSQQRLPDEFRLELALVLATLGQSYQFLHRALEHMPPTLAPQLLQRQTLDGIVLPFESPDFLTLLDRLDRQSMLVGRIYEVLLLQRSHCGGQKRRGKRLGLWQVDKPTFCQRARVGTRSNVAEIDASARHGSDWVDGVRSPSAQLLAATAG